MNKIQNKKIFFFIIIFAILIYILFFSSSSFYKKYVAKRKYLALKSKIEKIDEINKNLQIENEELENNPEVWEKKARAFGMQKESEEIFNNITLFKGSLLNMLENMNLVKTRAHLIKSLVLGDKEINANLIYSESEIKSFDPDEFEALLKEELNEKYENEPVIINKK